MKKTILFVCGHNAGRSQMAHALFNKYNTNPNYSGQSAGTGIADKVNPMCVEALKEEGIDLSDRSVFYPKALTPEMVEQAEKVFSMGCGVKSDLLDGVEIIDWDLDDPAGQDLESVKKVRDAVKARVLELVDELA